MGVHESVEADGGKIPRTNRDTLGGLFEGLVLGILFTFSPTTQMTEAQHF